MLLSYKSRLSVKDNESDHSDEVPSLDISACFRRASGKSDRHVSHVLHVSLTHAQKSVKGILTHQDGVDSRLAVSFPEYIYS